jgi:predicted ATPase
VAGSPSVSHAGWDGTSSRPAAHRTRCRRRPSQYPRCRICHLDGSPASSRRSTRASNCFSAWALGPDWRSTGPCRDDDGGLPLRRWARRSCAGSRCCRTAPAGTPSNVRAFANGIDLTLSTAVTFLVGENGSGKSTLLEALAECCGFNPEGGNRDHHRATFADRSPLAQALRLTWKPKVTEGFFMRAESFYNFATYLDEVSNLRAYGGKSLHAQSHGESFMALFTNRFEQGLYLLDEPEAALSPQRQLSFLRVMHDLATPGHAQFIVATHSPILLAYPGASIFSLDGDAIEPIEYRETRHYLITRDFLNAPERFFKHLLAPPEEPGDEG